MATRKDKHAHAVQKRNDFIEAMRTTGLAAQRKDIQRREAKLISDWRKNHDLNHSWKKRIKECPLCKMELSQARKANEKAQASR